MRFSRSPILSRTDILLTRRYKKEALKCHPDKPIGSAEKFLRCTKAFETLRDTDKKFVYDKYGEEALKQGWQSPEKSEREERQTSEEGFPARFFKQMRWGDAQRKERLQRRDGVGWRRAFSFQRSAVPGGGGDFFSFGAANFGIDEVLKMFQQRFGGDDSFQQSG